MKEIEMIKVGEDRQIICKVNSDVFHANNVVYLNTNVTIIVRRALENMALKHALPHPNRYRGKVDYGKFRIMLDGLKVIIGGSED